MITCTVRVVSVVASMSSSLVRRSEHTPIEQLLGVQKFELKSCFYVWNGMCYK